MPGPTVSGLSDVEGSEKLFVSVRNVGTHAGDVLAEMGARDHPQG